VILLGSPGTGKTHLATGLAIKACHAGYLVEFATAADWVTRLAEPHHAEIIAIKGDTYRLKDRDLGRTPLATTTE
jgi:broad-specificity NMP kinase